MAIFGLGTKQPTAVAGKPKNDDTHQKADVKQPASQADEAKAMLAKMQAKKDAGDCPFC